MLIGQYLFAEERRERQQHSEREKNRFGLEREGGECSQGRKFDDDHDYDG